MSLWITACRYFDSAFGLTFLVCAAGTVGIIAGMWIAYLVVCAKSGAGEDSEEQD